MPEAIARQPEKRYPNFEPLADTLVRMLEGIQSRGKEPKFKSGLQVLDEGLWGVAPTQLLTIAARPNVGKTAFACQIALQYALGGAKVAFFSLEMAREAILERMFCNDQEVDATKIRCGGWDAEIEKKYSAFCAKIANLQLRIIDDYCRNENEVYTLIEHLEFRPEVIFLDHIQHIQAHNKKTMWESISEYFRYLKELAMRYKIAVIVLSQINREGEDAPTLANLKGSGSLEEVSDFVMLLHQEKDSNYGNNFKISIAKNRFGPLACYELYYKGENLKFFNYAPPSEIPKWRSGKDIYTNA